jgi:hypothetical protein
VWSWLTRARFSVSAVDAWIDCNSAVARVHIILASGETTMSGPKPRQGLAFNRKGDRSNVLAELRFGLFNQSAIKIWQFGWVLVERWVLGEFVSNFFEAARLLTSFLSSTTLRFSGPSFGVRGVGVGH